MAERMGERIRERRVALGYSQEDAAIEAGLSRQSWSRIECDPEYEPKLSTMMRVATTLEWTLGELIRGRDAGYGTDGTNRTDGRGRM